MVNVATFCAPVPPTDTETQFRLVGLADALPPADSPVPLSVTVWGLLVAASVKLSVALRAPAADGLNTTDVVHVAAAARLVPQVLVEMVKSEAFVPPTAILLMPTDEVVPFDRVADIPPLAAPRLTLPKPSVAGL